MRLIGLVCLIVCLSMLCIGTAIAQSPVAYVYVAQTDQLSSEQAGTQPIYAYSVSADGKLTPLQGSPFTQISGQMVGTNGTHFITLGYEQGQRFGPLNYLYSYDVAPNGAIEKQVSEIDTQGYSGSDCPGAEQGTNPSGAELDHTGQYLYVPYCDDAVQTYKIEKSSGDPIFQHATIYNNADQTFGGMPKLAGNNTFAYNQTIVDKGPHGYPNSVFAAFVRKSDGSLEYRGVPTFTVPSLPENYYTDYFGLMSNDPTDHFAVMVGLQKFIPPDTTANEGCVLASFTVGSKGELTSTNPYDKMPQLPYCGEDMLLSPDGKTLAVLTENGVSLLLYNFDGAKPITQFAQLTRTHADPFGSIAFDRSDHLYALNRTSGKLYIYAVNSTDAVEAEGSPHDLPTPCPYDQPDGTYGCPQSLIVRGIP